MDLDARPYRSFIAVAETRSFSRAAQLLNVSQPALSAQIREFERRLGFALFARSSRRVDLTTEGSLFLDRARRLVTETEWVANAAREIRLNQLRIGAAHHTAAIAERNALIDGFVLAVPDVPVRVMGRSPAQLRDDLARGTIDVAISLDPDAPDHTADAPFHRCVLATRPVRLWVPDDHPLARESILEPAMLEGVPVGAIDRSHGVRVAEIVGHRLAAVGAEARKMPEGDAIAAARMSRCAGHCAVDLGWFDAPGGMVSRAVRGWDAVTCLVVLAATTGRRPGTDRFLAAIPG